MSAVMSCRLRPLARAVRPLFAMSLLLSAPAWADEPARRAYEVPAASLGAVLTRFADQAGVSLSLDPALVQGRQSSGLSGSYSVEEGFMQLLRGSGLQLLALQQRAQVLHYPDVRSLTHELKALGAHNLNPGRPAGLTGRARMQGLLQAYEHWRQPSGLPATYQVVYAVLRKPQQAGE